MGAHARSSSPSKGRSRVAGARLVRSAQHPRGLVVLSLVLTGLLIVLFRIAAEHEPPSYSPSTSSARQPAVVNFDFDSSPHPDTDELSDVDDQLEADSDDGSDDGPDEDAPAGSAGDDPELGEEDLYDDVDEQVNLRVLHPPKSHLPLLKPAPPPFLPYTCSGCPTSTLASLHQPPTCAKYSGPNAPNASTFDEGLIERSLVFGGTGSEVRRVLRRVIKSGLYAAKRDREGAGASNARYEDEEPFRIAVLGGSVSNCRGVGPLTTCWHARVQEWLQRTIPLEGDAVRATRTTKRSISSKRQKRSLEVHDKTSDEAVKTEEPAASEEAKAVPEPEPEPLLPPPERVQKRQVHRKAASRRKVAKKKAVKGTGTRRRPFSRLINLAKSATGSAFYAYCFDAEWETRRGKTTWGKGPDLVVLEFGVNDVWPTTEAATRDFERLLYHLRSMPSKPAIIILEAASLLLAQTSSAMTNAEYLHLPAAHFYDVPVISTKHALFGPTPAIRLESGLDIKDLFLPDLHHFNERGHELLADVLTSYLEDQACKVQSEILDAASERVAKVGGPLVVEPQLDIISRREERILPLPMRSLFTPFSMKPTLPFEVAPPTCLKIGHDESKIEPVRNVGWRQYAWARDKQYLTADKPGSSVTYEITVGKGGEVLVDWLRSRFYDLGNVLVYLDDRKSKGVVLEGWWDLGWSIGVPTVVFSGVSPGKHEVTFELLPASQSSHPNKKTAFRLIGIISS